MAASDLLLKDQNAMPASFAPETTDIGNNTAGTQIKRPGFGVADGADITLGAKGDAAATADAGGFSVVALVKRGLGNWTTLLARIPALGVAAKAASMPVALANDDVSLSHIDAITAAIAGATAPVGPGSAAAASRIVKALASNGTQTSVAASAADTTILAANSSRLSLKVFNDSSTATLFLLLASGTSSPTNYTVQVPPGGFFTNDDYAGIVKGLWSAASGAARVTEMT